MIGRTVASLTAVAGLLAVTTAVAGRQGRRPRVLGILPAMNGQDSTCLPGCLVAH
jgi:hypothetical protein